MKEVKPHAWTDGGDKVLILRRSNADGKSMHGFQFPESGIVEAPKKWWGDGPKPEGLNLGWNSEAVCGGGLHGWPWGMGLGEGVDYDIIDDKWQVVACLPDDVVGLVFYGAFAAAWAMVNSGRHRLIQAMAKPASSGDSANNASSGHYGSIDMRGKNSVGVAAGVATRIRGVDGCSFALAWKDGEITRFVCGVVGEKGVKPSTWYVAEKGELVEVKI